MANRKELFTKLRSIQIELFRNAADLDRTITELELVSDDPAGEEYIRLFNCQKVASRTATISMCKWDKLYEQEKDIWQQLINAKEES